jgi:5-(carboxyamino)imidazole ribonucleotide synthase
MTVCSSVPASSAAGPASPFVAPGATLGVMGGGQLARMFVQAAHTVGYATAVLDPDPESPAGAIAHRHIRAGYLDTEGLDALAACSAAITTEFENVPADALARLATTRSVAPSAAAVAVCQDRAAEKAHFVACGVPCAPQAVVAAAGDIDRVPAELLPGILKTARFGYDGKGQARVASRDALRQAWAGFGGVACVLEALLPLAYEISVVVARGADGASVHLPVQQNLHRDGVLALTRVPAPDAPASLQSAVIDAAQRIAARLGYVGVLCVEFFVLADGTLVANEMAPRPHNSGHYSIDGCDLSQFDLQVRALVGAPLVAPRLHSACCMLNLLGELWLERSAAAPAAAPRWAEVLALPGVHLHLYGKAEARPGRKMGHLTVTASTADAADATARAAAALLGIAGW